MRALETKLVRDLWHLRGQAFTIAALVGVGLASYLGSISTYRTLVRSRDAYYRQSRFADLFAEVVRAPDALLPEVRALTGVGAAQGTIVEPARLDLPGLTEPARGTFVSVEPGSSEGLNALFIREGRTVERAGEVVVSELFARAHQLAPGSSLTAIIGGRALSLRVVGVGLSPEYVWIVPPGGFAGDEQRYGVFWMDREELAAASQMQDSFNQLALQLAPGASRAAVTDAIDSLLQPFGSFGVQSRERQLSNRLVTQELGQLRGTAILLPAIFLGVAVFLLNVFLGRIVGAQREQLATLKALGYRNAALAFHYVELALVVIAGGIAMGTALGSWVGSAFVGLYANYFRFPSMAFRLEPGLLVGGIAICVGAGLLGALGAVRHAVRLAPAEAMRPASPAVYRPTLVERLRLDRLLRVQGRMILRDLERNPVRAALSSVAIALATSILVFGNMAFDSIDEMFRIQFGQVELEDLSVTYDHPRPDRARHALLRIPGVLDAEPLRVAPVRISFGPRVRDTSLTGLAARGALRRVLGPDRKPMQLPESGLVLSRALARMLGVQLGAQVEIEVLEGSRRKRQVPVVAVADEMLGMGGFMEHGALARLLGESPLDSGALLAVDRRHLDEVIRRLSRIPQISSVNRTERMAALAHKQISEIFLTYQLIMTAFAAVIAVGVVYNNARIALAQRSRDLATLRIVGFTRGEVSALLLGEQAVQLFVGIPLGFPLGRLIGKLIFTTVDPEMFSVPVTVTHRTLAFAAMVVVLSAAVSALLVRRGADRLDLVAVLKAAD